MENHLISNDHEAVNYFNPLSAFPMHSRRPLRTGRLHSAFQAEVEALSCLDADQGFFRRCADSEKMVFLHSNGVATARAVRIFETRFWQLGRICSAIPGFMKSKMTARRFAAVQR